MQGQQTEERQASVSWIGVAAPQPVSGRRTEAMLTTCEEVRVEADLTDDAA